MGWTRLGQATFCLRTVSWEALVTAGLLVGGASCCVGGLGAAWLYGLVRVRPPAVTIWRPSSNVPPALTSGTLAIRFRSGIRVSRGAPQRTSVEQTILDVANEADELTTVDVASRALAQQLTTATRLGQALATRAHLAAASDDAERVAARLNGGGAGAAHPAEHVVAEPAAEHHRQHPASNRATTTTRHPFGRMVFTDPRRDADAITRPRRLGQTL